MAYYVRPGWNFERDQYGRVHVYHEIPGFERRDEFTISAQDWSELIADVSAIGSTTDQLYRAELLHTGHDS